MDGQLNFHFGINVNPWPGQYVDTVSKVVGVTGVIRADRANPAMDSNVGAFECGPSYPENRFCYEFSGTTLIMLERIPADLQLTADSSSVTVGSTVHFIYVPNPTTADGKAVPMTDVKRTWIPDDTSQGGNPAEQIDSTSACVIVTPTSCKRVINGPGTMVVRAKVNGKTIEKSHHVSAVPCSPIADQNPLVEELLNSPTVLNGLKNALLKSNPDSVPVLRRERGGYIYKDTLTGKLHFQQYLNISTPCSYHPIWPPPAGPPNTIVVAAFHTHPFVPLFQTQPVERIPPGTCHRAPKGGPPLPWPSTEDNDSAKEMSEYFGRDVPLIAADKMQLYVTFGPIDERLRSTHPRHVGTCKRY